MIYQSLIRTKAYELLKSLHPDLYETNGYQYFKRQAKNLYAGCEHPSYNVSFYDKVKQAVSTRVGKHANPTKFICEDMTRLSFGEKAIIKINNNTSVDNYFQNVFKETQFILNLKNLTEKSFYALGGMAAMPYISNKKLTYDWIDADFYIPIQYTQTDISGAKYAKIGKKDKVSYVLIVINEIINGSLIITNELYTYQKNKEEYKRSELKSLFPEAEETIVLENFDEILITYGKNAKANNVDFDTPEGLPFTSNAEDLIELFNMNIDNIYSELKAGKQKQAVPQKWLTSFTNQYGDFSRGIDYKNDEIIIAPDGALDVTNEITTFSGDYRSQEIIDMGQGLLNLISVQLGLDAGYYSFNPDGSLTATEVISKRSKTYTEKRNEEKNIQDFVEKLIKNSVKVLQLEGLAFGGIDADKLDIQFIADDSIITDDNKQGEVARTEVSENLRSDYDYMINIRKLTPNQAQEELDRIDKRAKEKQDAFFDTSNEDDNEENEDDEEWVYL